VADLVGSLDGEAALTLRHGLLPGIAPGAAAEPAALPVLALRGPLALTRGVAASPPPGLDLTFPGGEAKVAVSLDLLPWMMDVRLEAPDQPFSLRLLGPPGRLRQVLPPLPQPAPASSP
jgi:hypothetical protein